MSAIYGRIGKFTVTKSIEDCMNRMPSYKFTRSEYITRKNVDFFCFHTAVTKESVDEILPFYDEENNVLITSDAILDNRDQLFELLSISDRSINDSQIIVRAYSEWGENLCKYLIGDFSFAIYDFNLNSLIIGRDQIGNRILYYHHNGENFEFSTSLELLKNRETKYNKHYLREFLSNVIIRDSYLDNQTIYDDIYILNPASIIIFKNNNICEKKYWKLEKNKYKKTYEECIIDFKKIYSEAVQCRLRTKDNVGLMLSSGLDSASIISMAGKIEGKDNLKLNTYTSVPDDILQLNRKPEVVYDESELVRVIMNDYENTKSYFLNFSSLDAVNTIESNLGIMEQPYKFIENSHWLLNITNDAKIGDCSVLLTGLLGNLTVSYSNPPKQLFQYLLKFKVNKIIKALNMVSISSEKSKTELLFRVLKDIKHRVYLNTHHFVYSYSKLNNKELRIFKRKIKKYINSMNATTCKRRYFDMILDPSNINQRASYMTKDSLASGVVVRDPTADIRVIEFCYNLPEEFFHYNFKQRSLIKDIMKNDIPDLILDSISKGLQSADWKIRLEKNWDSYYDIIFNKVTSVKELNQYIDLDEFLTLLENNKKLRNLERSSDLDLRGIITVYNFAVFLDSNKIS